MDEETRDIAIKAYTDLLVDPLLGFAVIPSKRDPNWLLIDVMTDPFVLPGGLPAEFTYVDDGIKLVRQALGSDEWICVALFNAIKRTRIQCKSLCDDLIARAVNQKNPLPK